jgi:hypothetical protein
VGAPGKVKEGTKVRRFIKGWCISFGVVAGVFLTVDGHPYDGLYVLLMGIVLVVLEAQDLEQTKKTRMGTKWLVGVLREQFGAERAANLLDEYCVRNGIVTQKEVDEYRNEVTK